MSEQLERICISPNSICNLACKYCYFYNPDRNQINQEKMSSEEIFTILTKIEQYSQHSFVKKKIKVNIVGSGEPLLSWQEIKEAMFRFHKKSFGKNIKFYTITNGTLITKSVAKELRELKITPSVSLDGPPIINDKNRLTKTGKGTFKKTMKGIEYLYEEGFEKIINTTITQDFILHVDEYFDFLLENNITKVVFGRLVDVPTTFRKVSYDEFYSTLSDIYDYYKENKMHNEIEIGNFESYKRSILHNIFYFQRDVYPCGRMFDNSYWKIGEYDESPEIFQQRMKEKIKYRVECKNCELEEICLNDCMLEQQDINYNCDSRKNFILKMKADILTERNV